MTALSADRRVPKAVAAPDGSQTGFITKMPVAATETIYKGAFVELDAGGDLVAAGVNTNQAFGIALEKADNSAGADAAISVSVLCGAVISHAVASGGKTELGNPVYAIDDQTLTTVATGNNLVGWLVSVPVVGDPLVKMAVLGQNID